MIDLWCKKKSQFLGDSREHVALVIWRSSLFTLIRCFLKHTLTQEENLAGVDIMSTGVQLFGMCMLKESLACSTITSQF